MESKIIVKRKFYTDKSTVGELSFDDFKCFTLEDTVRKDGEKVCGKTAIPKGRYEVAINYSNKFGRLMPLLLNVHGFDGIRIHSGNAPEHTLGCLLLGYGYDEKVPDQITDSRKAYNVFFDKLKKEIEHGKVFIDIS